MTKSRAIAIREAFPEAMAARTKSRSVSPSSRFRPTQVRSMRRMGEACPRASRSRLSSCRRRGRVESRNSSGHRRSANSSRLICFWPERAK